jgi:hypothetical protein
MRSICFRVLVDTAVAVEVKERDVAPVVVADSMYLVVEACTCHEQS